ncbi:MAG: hypothetical protein ABWJ42_05655 [Sulfolobales archaeon]
MYADLMLLNINPFITSVYRESGVRVIGVPRDLEVDERVLRDFFIIRRVIIDDIDRLREEKNYLIAFKPRDKESARRAGKVESFSLTILIDEDTIEYCTREQIEVMRGKSTSLEILARAILDDRKAPRYLRHLGACVKYAVKNGVDIIISSGSRTSEEIFPPRSFRVVERYLIGIRGVLTYSWFHVLEKWNKNLVREIGSVKKREKT